MESKLIQKRGMGIVDVDELGLFTNFFTQHF